MVSEFVIVTGIVGRDASGTLAGQSDRWRFLCCDVERRKGFDLMVELNMTWESELPGANVIAASSAHTTVIKPRLKPGVVSISGVVSTHCIVSMIPGEIWVTRLSPHAI